MVNYYQTIQNNLQLYTHTAILISKGQSSINLESKVRKDHHKLTKNNQDLCVRCRRRILPAFNALCLYDKP